MECFKQEKQSQYIELKYGKKNITVYLDWSLKDKLIINVFDPNTSDESDYLFSKELKIK
jgi:hypothetical protein|tara:strand:- start:1149 stop:1325 length:177 start_codon:yes stop_codon:yes gene_type:complete